MEAVLSPWRVKRPHDWMAEAKQPVSAREPERLHLSVERGQLFGAGGWVKRVVSELDLEFTIRLEGRRRQASGPDTSANN
jgi:hypothetical protein